MFVLGAYLSYRLVPHVADRVDIWLHPWQDVYGRGYQSVQALYAIADGGAFGTGLGPRLPAHERRQLGRPGDPDRLHLRGDRERDRPRRRRRAAARVPARRRSAGSRSASLAGDGFSKLLAAGLTIALGLQVFLIVGGIVRAAPLTGITLPFVSYGGSSLVANWVALALLCAISDRARREAQA